MNSVNLVYYKNGNEHWVVDGVYALNHSARARASTLRTKQGKKAIVITRTVRKNRKK